MMKIFLDTNVLDRNFNNSSLLFSIQTINELKWIWNVDIFTICVPEIVIEEYAKQIYEFLECNVQKKSSILEQYQILEVTFEIVVDLLIKYCQSAKIQICIKNFETILVEDIYNKALHGIYPFEPRKTEKKAKNTDKGFKDELIISTIYSYLKDGDIVISNDANFREACKEIAYSPSSFNKLLYLEYFLKEYAEEFFNQFEIQLSDSIIDMDNVFYLLEETTELTHKYPVGISTNQALHSSKYEYLRKEGIDVECQYIFVKIDDIYYKLGVKRNEIEESHIDFENCRILTYMTYGDEIVEIWREDNDELEER